MPDFTIETQKIDPDSSLTLDELRRYVEYQNRLLLDIMKATNHSSSHDFDLLRAINERLRTAYIRY